LPHIVFLLLGCKHSWLSMPVVNDTSFPFNGIVELIVNNLGALYLVYAVTDLEKKERSITRSLPFYMLTMFLLLLQL